MGANNRFHMYPVIIIIIIKKEKVDSLVNPPDKKHFFFIFLENLTGRNPPKGAGR